MTYTTAAAICGAAALFSYGTSKGSGRETAVTAAFSALTWCIRDELFFMIVPMAGLIWLFRELPQKKEIWKKLLLPAAVFGSVAVCMLWNHLMYSSTEWKEYLHFNEVRTEIYDYADGYYLPGYEEYQEYYDRLGLTKEERRMLIYYHFLPLEDEISVETLEQMIAYRGDYGANEELPPLRERIPAKTKEFARHAGTGEYGILFTAGLIGFLSLTVWLFLKKYRREALESAVYFFAGLGIFWIMELRGRIPERVIYSLSLLMFTAFVLNVIWNREKLFAGKYGKRVLAAGIVGCSLLGIYRCADTVMENRAVIENEQKLITVQNYCNSHEKQFFFITGDVLNDYGDVIRLSGKDNRQLNYISLGDWISYSPLERARIAQENIGSVTDALLNREDIYLIAEQESASLQFVADYLAQRSGQEIRAEKVDEITEEYAVYRLK